MEQNCQNCNTLILKNFCDNCGQKKFKKIDRKYVFDEIQYTFLHTNKGFLYSIKKVIKNPGKTAREFIDGNRVNHYKPILLVFLLSGISAFVSFQILGMHDIMEKFSASTKNLNSPLMRDYFTFTKNYSSLIMLLLVPVFALTTKLAFRKWGHNYYEHIVMNAYIVSTYTLFTVLVISPILYFFKDNYAVFIKISSLAFVAVPFILVWFFKNFYNDKPLKSVIGRVLLVFGFLLTIYILVVIIAVIVGIICAFIFGPEAMHYMMPKQIPGK